MRITFDTERLTLVTARLSMARAAAEFYIRNEEHLREWEDAKPDMFYSEAYQRQMLKIEIKRLKQGAGIDFWIYKKGMRDIVGKVSVFGIVSGNYSLCVLGYKLDYEAVGKGYMTEAIKGVERYLFDELNIMRIEVNIMPKNSRSLSVVERLGYRLECFIPSYIRINGAWEDHFRFVKTNDSWRLNEY
ncbi:MAG: GNAT family N-acetyltransferase [Eubacteriaceae bacterium]|nr:GNAT family N-acetyltransferase [Eubacteriaceae bacterium]